MLRLLILCLPLLVVSGRTADEAQRRDPARQADGLAEGMAAAARVSGAVRARFALAASGADCRFANNLYGYNLLLAQVGDVQRAAIRAAAGEGDRQGAAALEGGVATPCAAIMNRLEAADDALVVLAERVKAGALPLH